MAGATPSTGAVASYYDDPTASRDFANKTPVMVRNDPSIAFSWGAETAPGPGLGTDNYLVRWAAALSPPATGSYTFYAGTTDGIRVFVNNVKVLERWSDPGGATNDTIPGTAVSLTQGQAVPLVVEYFEGGGVAQVAWPPTGRRLGAGPRP